jgi:hypothetical protein
MVIKTVRRAFSGLTSALKTQAKANPRVTRTLKSAQRHADDAWKRAVHGPHNHSHHKRHGQ